MTATDPILAAGVLLHADVLNGAVARAYGEVHHRASTLLPRKGLETKTHRGEIQVLSLHLVRDRFLDEDTVANLPRPGDVDALSDYSAFVDFAHEDAGDAIRRARQFTAACRPLL